MDPAPSPAGRALLPWLILGSILFGALLTLVIVLLVVVLRDDRRPPYQPSYAPPPTAAPAAAPPAVVIAAPDLTGVRSPWGYRFAVMDAIRLGFDRFWGPRWITVVTIDELPAIRTVGGASVWLWPRATVVVEILGDGSGLALPLPIAEIRRSVVVYLAERVEDPATLQIEVVVVDDPARQVAARARLREQADTARAHDAEPTGTIIVPIPIMPIGGGGGHRSSGSGSGSGCR